MNIRLFCQKTWTSKHELNMNPTTATLRVVHHVLSPNGVQLTAGSRLLEEVRNTFGFGEWNHALEEPARLLTLFPIFQFKIQKCLFVSKISEGLSYMQLYVLAHKLSFTHLLWEKWTMVTTVLGITSELVFSTEEMVKPVEKTNSTIM